MAKDTVPTSEQKVIWNLQVQRWYIKDYWGKKKKIEVDSYRILPLDPNTPNPFSTEYKCHPPSCKYIGKKECNVFECLKQA